jgi:hypothetical protein
MANLQQKAAKEAEHDAGMRKANLRATGYTVFRFDFAPKFTRRDLSLGDAIRELKRLTGYKIGFWRCPVRGMAVRYQSPPTTSYSYDKGTTSVTLRFSTAEEETEAKRELLLDALLLGIDLYRGLPNEVYNEQTDLLRALLTARPSVEKDEWLALKARLHPKIEPLLKTHDADLRQNLLGQRYK